MASRSQRFVRRLLLVMLVALGGAACTSVSSPEGTSAPASIGQTGAAIGGGTPVFISGEGWPTCLNPVLDCGDSDAFRSTIQNFVFPRLTRWSNTLELQPTPLIDEVPSLENGGLTESPFTVTYHLNPTAVWHDGTPITCDDVLFTWLAILNTTGTYVTTPYGSDLMGGPGISKVACPDARTVKLDFIKIDVLWPEFFGGTDGFILEKAAFPDADPTKPDLKDEMKDSIPFSGGPFVLQNWSKDQAVLVRNDTYWATKPTLDQAVFVPGVDPATTAADLVAAKADAIAPTATNVPFARTFAGDQHVQTVGSDSNTLEALWFQLDDPLIKIPLVRQAFVYAMDRDAVTKGVPALNDPAAKTNQCGPWVPAHGPWCPSTGPFARYGFDPAHADELLTRAGYDCSKVADEGFCTKNGRPLRITISATVGDVQAATAVAILGNAALAAGIDLQLRTYQSTRLFSDVLPKGEFQVAMYRFGPVIDPSVTGILSCSQIPTAANGYGGGNWDHWCDRAADHLMLRSDQELDVAKRADEIQGIGTLIAKDLPMLPLYTLPNVAAWRTDKLAGIDPADVSSPYGFFVGLPSWHIP